MTRTTPGGKRRVPSGFRAGLLSWYLANKPVLSYAGKFAAMILLFSLLSLTPPYQSLFASAFPFSVSSMTGISHHARKRKIPLRFEPSGFNRASTAHI